MEEVVGDVKGSGSARPEYGVLVCTVNWVLRGLPVSLIIPKQVVDKAAIQNATTVEVQNGGWLGRGKRVARAARR